jgi:hypothetical protein
MSIFNFTIQKEENGVHSVFSNYKPAHIVDIFSGDLSNIFIKEFSGYLTLEICIENWPCDRSVMNSKTCNLQCLLLSFILRYNWPTFIWYVYSKIKSFPIFIKISTLLLFSSCCINPYLKFMLRFPNKFCINDKATYTLLIL